MNEFQGKSLKDLEILLMNINSYRQGIIDTFKICNEFIEKSIELMTDKHLECESEIARFKNGASNDNMA